MVVLRPVDHRVDHEVLAHRVFGRDVGAAGRGLDTAGGVQALVVAGHDAVKHGVGGLTRRGRVVVDLVEDDLHADRVQTTHHGAELAHARATVLLGRGRVGALGGHPVQRVVAPVVGVLVGHGHDRRLLLLGRRAGTLGDRGRLLVGALLGDGRDVESGQQVHRVHAGARQLGQVAHAVGLELREGHVGAAHVLGHRRIRCGEVAHVQLVDGALGVILDDGGLGVRPHRGGNRRIVHIDGDGARRVNGQGHRVGVGHEVRLHLARLGHVDADLPQVLGTLVDLAGSVVHAPAAVLAAHGGGAQAVTLHVGVGATRSRGVPRQQGHVLGSGCPQRERRVSRLVPSHAVRGLGGLGRVEGVEYGYDLHAGEGVDALSRLLGDRDLAGEGLAGPSLVEGGLQGNVSVEVRVGRRHLGGQVTRDGQGARRSAGDDTIRQAGAALGGGHQLIGELRGTVENLRASHTLGQQRGRPRENVRGHPVGALLTGAHDRSVSARDVDLVRLRIVGEGHELVRFRCKLVVGTADGAILPVILVVGPADGNLELIVALRQRGRGVGVGAVPHRLHERRQACGLPVISAAQRLLERARQRHHLVGRGVPHAVRRAVVEEGDGRRFAQGVGDVCPSRSAPGTERRVPRAALGDLVLILTGRKRERRAVHARRVARERSLIAAGCPVRVASHRRVVVTGDCHQHVGGGSGSSRVGSSRIVTLV